MYSLSVRGTIFFAKLGRRIQRKRMKCTFVTIENGTRHMKMNMER